jgi:hypothetical protein
MAVSGVVDAPNRCIYVFCAESEVSADVITENVGINHEPINHYFLLMRFDSFVQSLVKGDTLNSDLYWVRSASMTSRLYSTCKSL